MNYAKAVIKANEARENNDCGVKAVAIACDVAYIVAKKALEKQGRIARKGASLGSILDAFKALGFKAERVELKAKTVTGLESDPTVKAGHYVALVRGHILAIKNGSVEDWTEGRKHRIVLAYKITPNATRNERKALAKAALA